MSLANFNCTLQKVPGAVHHPPSLRKFICIPVVPCGVNDLEVRHKQPQRLLHRVEYESEIMHRIIVLSPSVSLHAPH